MDAPMYLTARVQVKVISAVQELSQRISTVGTDHHCYSRWGRKTKPSCFFLFFKKRDTVTSKVYFLCGWSQRGREERIFQKRNKRTDSNTKKAKSVLMCTESRAKALLRHWALQKAEVIKFSASSKLPYGFYKRPMTRESWGGSLETEAC